MDLAKRFSAEIAAFSRTERPEDAFMVSVSREIADPGRASRRRSSDLDGSASQFQRPGSPDQPSQSPDELRLPVPGDPGKADDLPGERQADVAEALARETIDDEPRIGRWGPTSLSGKAASRARPTISSIRSASLTDRRRSPADCAIPEDGHPIGDHADLRQAVADVHDGRFVLRCFPRSAKTVELRPKRSRWLVEDEVDGEIENALANSINWRFATPTSSTRTSTSTLHPTRSSS